jgi:hypothetical protein
MERDKIERAKKLVKTKADIRGIIKELYVKNTEKII